MTAPWFWFTYLPGLVAVALLLVGLYAVVRGLSRGRVLLSANRRLLTVVESTMLSQHAAVHVIKAGSRYFVVGGGNGGLTTLAELPSDEVERWLTEQRAAFVSSRATLANVINTLRGKT